MRAKVVSMAVVMVSLALAGCAGDDDAPLDTEGALASGLGAIRGLLVDDRFRPIQLTDDPVTEFQADGFILIAETGDQMQTSSNGEFESPPLDPGRYTLRFTVDGHEAVPQTITVGAGQVTEATAVARRITSTVDLVIQEEFSIFIPCTFGFIVTPMQADCIPDRSGETTRFAFTMQLEEGDIKRDASFLLTEVLLNKEAGEALQGTYMMQVEGESQDGVTSYNYVSKFIKTGKYDSVLLERGVNSEYQEDPILTYGVWEDTSFVRWRFWGQGFFQPELSGALNPVIAPTGYSVGYGVGVQLGTKATVLASMFFTDDRTVPEGFCGLCGGLN